MADISKITTLDGTTYNLKDAAVPAWAKADTKPTYTAQEVGAKAVQSAVSDPIADGSAVEFIANISQNAQGVILPTKKSVPNASTTAAGLMSAADKTKLDDANACTTVGPSAIASFSDAYVADALDVTIGIEPIQSGSGDPSPTNVRPISGWTGCNIKRTNSNLADNDYFANLSNYHASTGGYSYVEYFLRAGTYTISFAKQTSGGYARIGQSFFLINGRPYSYTFTLEKDHNLEIYLNAYSEETLSRYFVDGNGIIITAGSTIGTFEPTATSTNRIPFPSEVGTVYGGTLGVTTGLLTVTHGNIASYNGESLPGKWISSMDVYSAGGTPTTGAQVVYELATPQTYQLTPTDVEMLLGDNNVWADTGETTVAYLRDDSLCINRAIEALRLTTVTGIKGNAEDNYRKGLVNLTPENIGAIPTTQKGVAGGVAELDSNGKVPSSQLPPGNGDVTGVKGAAESSYRTGQINLTAANIGAVAKSGDTMTGTLTIGDLDDGFICEIDDKNILIYKDSSSTDYSVPTIQLRDAKRSEEVHISSAGGIEIYGPVPGATAKLAYLNGDGLFVYNPATTRTNLDVPSTTGSGASGTWGIGISGNAATATKATQDADGNTISSTYLKLSGGTMTGGLTIQSNGLWVQGGSSASSNNSRMGLSAGMPDAFPYNTSKRGVKIYSNAIALADPYNGNSNSDAGWIRHLEETGNSGILEIGVGDDGNESIVARQYNTSSSVVRTLTLLDSLGNTTIPRMLSVASIGETGSYDQAAIQIREYNYANANTDTWGHAPRLAWHWSGRVAAQIGLSSNGYLYEAPVTGTTFYKIMYESGTWGINITGNADTVDNYHASDLWRKDGGTWNGSANIACTPTAAGQEYSFDLGNAYTETYWQVWSGKNGATILACYNDDRRVNIPVRLDTAWLRVVNNSSNNSDNAMVYLENKSNDDWALIVNCEGYNYGINITTADNGNALQTQGRIICKSLFANQGTNGERQIGVDSGTTGNLYMWANTTDKGIYSSSGYMTGHVIRITSDSRTFFGNCTGSAGSVAWGNVSGRPTIDKTTVIYQISRGNNFDPIQSGYWAGMTTQSGINSNWWHVLSMDWSGNDTNNWISQLAIPTGSDNGIYYRTRHSSTTNAWVKCLDANNYTNYTVTKTGSGASGTWGINITGNATTFGKNSNCLLSTNDPVNDQVLVIGFKALRNVGSVITQNDILSFIVYNGQDSEHSYRKLKLYNSTTGKTIWQYT